ncbi:MAG: histidine phosphatase family protein [Rhodospirillales bacterium]|nr:MAG: histidine phosphatase family protein [Rhodospirillales bacterium]
MIARRAFALGALGALAARPVAAQDALWVALRAGGVDLLIRHARAPGTYDPPGFRLDDCATQRNLSDEGRAQARRLGAALTARGVRVAEVRSSRWCRCRDTAREAFGAGEPLPLLDSAVGLGLEAGAARAKALIAWIAANPPPRDAVRALVTHHVNILAVTGLHMGDAEAVAIRVANGVARIVGALPAQ